MNPIMFLPISPFVGAVVVLAIHGYYGAAAVVLLSIAVYPAILLNRSKVASFVFAKLLPAMKRVWGALQRSSATAWKWAGEKKSSFLSVAKPAVKRGWGAFKGFTSKSYDATIRKTKEWHVASKPHLSRALAWSKDRAIKAGGAASKKLGGLVEILWEGYRKGPHLWNGILLLLLSMYYFGSAYTEVAGGDYATPLHAGLGLMGAGIVLLLIHFEKIEAILRAIWGNKVWTWIILSIITLVVAFGHALLTQKGGWWYVTGVSFASLVAGLISLKQGLWAEIGLWCIKAIGKLSGEAVNLLVGGKGGTLAIIAWFIILFTGSVVALSASIRNFDSDLRSIAEAMTSVYSLLLFFGVGAIMYIRSRKWVDKIIK